MKTMRIIFLLSALLLGQCQIAQVANHPPHPFWENVRQLCSEHSIPFEQLGLRPGLTEKDIRTLERKLDVRFPETWKSILRQYGGQGDWSYGLIDGTVLLSPDQILELHRTELEIIAKEGNFEPYDADDPEYDSRIQNLFYHEKWIPITDSDGDGYYLDFSPTETGAVGQVIYWMHDAGPALWVAPNFDAFIRDYIDHIQSGRVHYFENLGFLLEETPGDLDYLR